MDHLGNDHLMAANSQKERHPKVVCLLMKNKIFLPKNLT